MLFGASFTDKDDRICYVLEDLEDQRNNGIYILDLPEALKSAPTLVGEAKPSNFAILGNYPNPFNPSTAIEFSLGKAGSADISLYNVAGQKVRELLSGSMKAGVHTVVWNGRDNFGRTVSAGVYIAKLTMGSSVTAKSMMLVK